MGITANLVKSFGCTTTMGHPIGEIMRYRDTKTPRDRRLCLIKCTPGCVNKVGRSECHQQVRRSHYSVMLRGRREGYRYLWYPDPLLLALQSCNLGWNHPYTKRHLNTSSPLATTLTRVTSKPMIQPSHRHVPR